MAQEILSALPGSGHKDRSDDLFHVLALALGIIWLIIDARELEGFQAKIPHGKPGMNRSHRGWAAWPLDFMGFRFSCRVSILPGLRLNLSGRLRYRIVRKARDGYSEEQFEQNDPSRRTNS